MADQASTPETAVEAVVELSDLLETGLDRDALAILTRLSDQGVSPTALAAVVTELRKERDALAAATASAARPEGTAAAATGGAGEGGIR
mmetsp:Transcript_24491/g.76541  ORF Transcript_24491/g.76541 Transcript_24491/m.76541 type:complete len:89 (-) Transcript_24491:45-311(-)